VSALRPDEWYPGVLGILREFNAEQAVLAGGAELQRRVNALAARRTTSRQSTI
jgi:hypothetical protein